MAEKEPPTVNNLEDFPHSPLFVPPSSWQQKPGAQHFTHEKMCSSFIPREYVVQTEAFILSLVNCGAEMLQFLELLTSFFLPFSFLGDVYQQNVFCFLSQMPLDKLPKPANTEVFGSNGSVGDGHFVRYSRKSVTLGFFNGKFQFGDRQNIRYSRKSVISESGTSENLCTYMLAL